LAVEEEHHQNSDNSLEVTVSLPSDQTVGRSTDLDNDIDDIGLHDEVLAKGGIENDLFSSENDYFSDS
jgi:hypothetical protein